MLDKLTKQYGISESDIAEEHREIAWFRYKTPLEEKLLFQVIYSVVGDRGVYERKNRNTKKKYKMQGVECTPAERLERCVYLRQSGAVRAVWSAGRKVYTAE